MKVKVIDLRVGQQIAGDTHPLTSVTKGPIATRIVRGDGTETSLPHWTGVPGYGAYSTVTIERGN